MPDKKDEGAHIPLVCPTCARPLEDERHEADSEGRTWLKFGGPELE